MDNGKFYYISAICTDGLHSGATPSEHPDKCNGDYLKEWYCSRSSDASSLHSTCPITEDSFSHCSFEGTRCAFGCSNGACNRPNFGQITPILPGTNSGDSTDGGLGDLATVKCCLNPESDVCVPTTVKECCPDNGRYNLGPKSQTQCANSFFKSGPNAGAPCLDLSDGSCTQACCCVRTYDDSDNAIIEANLDEYKINCQGKDKIFTNQGCSNARCRSLFDAESTDVTNANTDTADNNEDTDTTDGSNTNKGAGFEEICESGQCLKGTFCLKDFDKNEKRCCNEGQCLAQSVCFDNGTKLHRKEDMFICEDSKWLFVKAYAKLIINEDSCKNRNGTCRGGFLSFRKISAFLGFRGGNFCNNDEYDYSSCGNFGFLNIEKRCCIRTN
jgi:hypothetical protein